MIEQGDFGSTSLYKFQVSACCHVKESLLWGAGKSGPDFVIHGEYRPYQLTVLQFVSSYI